MQFRRRVLGSELRPEPDASMWSTSRPASSLPAIHDGPLLARSVSAPQRRNTAAFWSSADPFAMVSTRRK